MIHVHERRILAPMPRLLGFVETRVLLQGIVALLSRHKNHARVELRFTEWQAKR